MIEDSIKVPDSLPNLAVYYERAITSFFSNPMKRWSEEEVRAIGELVGDYAGHLAKKYGHINCSQILDVPAAATVLKDIDELRLPKHVCLLKWLAPEGICTQEPALVSEIAKRFL